MASNPRSTSSTGSLTPIARLTFSSGCRQPTFTWSTDAATQSALAKLEFPGILRYRPEGSVVYSAAAMLQAGNLGLDHIRTIDNERWDTLLNQAKWHSSNRGGLLLSRVDVVPVAKKHEQASEPVESDDRALRTEDAASASDEEEASVYLQFFFEPR